MYELTCPYCEHEFKISYFEGEQFDEECPKCGEEFEVYVEFTPSFEVRKIEYAECDECHKQHRTSEMRTQHSYPIPNKYAGVEKFRLCYRCWHKLYEKDMKEFVL